MASRAPIRGAHSILVPGDAPSPEGSAEARKFYQAGGKAGFVQGLFDRIAPRYDFLNTVTSFGMHTRWREQTIRLSGLKPGDSALDIACGTGDFLIGLRRRVGGEGSVTGVDFSRNMLGLAQTKLKKRRISATLLQADAQKLPIRSKCIDTITVGFALRNLTDLDACFSEMHRVLATGGRLLALEIARPGWWPYRPLFLLYFQNVLPLIAGVLGGDSEVYRWLPASLAAFGSREAVVAALERAGFAEVTTHNLAAGAVCIYRGVKS